MDRFPAPKPVVRTPAASPALLTYELFYGLREKPFSLSTDPRFLYRSSSHASAFEDLLLAIRRREGLIVLTGDIGTGKTTLCKGVLENLDRKTFTTFVPDPFVTREDLLKMLLLDFGVMSVDDLKSGRMTGASHPDLSYPLYDFLKSLVPLHAFAVLIIDEAQNLSQALLEEIRILSDLEMPDKLLQVVLVGQLELRAKLKLPEMRQLDQRVSARCTLQPLTREGVTGYIAHRLDVAGGDHDRVQFSTDAIDALFRVSGGTPRVINLVCDRALHLGHRGRTHVIDLDVVTQAIHDLEVGALTAAPPVATAPAPAATAAAPAPAPAPASAAPAPAATAAPVEPARAAGSTAGVLHEWYDVVDSSLSSTSKPVASISQPWDTIVGHRRPRKPWRWRIMRWATAATVTLAILFFAMLGEAVYINYFPALGDYDLQLPAAPSPPPFSSSNQPVPTPADALPPVPMTQAPPGQPAQGSTAAR